MSYSWDVVGTVPKNKSWLQWKAQLHPHKKQSDNHMPGKNTNKHGDCFTHISAFLSHISFYSPLPLRHKCSELFCYTMNSEYVQPLYSPWSSVPLQPDLIWALQRIQVFITGIRFIKFNNKGRFHFGPDSNPVEAKRNLNELQQSLFGKHYPSKPAKYDITNQWTSILCT